ncbi:MAG: endolytic transglycosylase MltG [Treponema sp.]|uniref:endolytic transglycosylase MltG n=1 Tax=Treponema sp. TaxID=166 RepID=UPI003FA2E109
MKKYIRYVLYFIAALLCAGAVGIYGLTMPPAAETEGSEQLFTIKRGTSVRTVAADLQTAGLVRSGYAAYFYFRLLRLPLKAGTYKLSSAMSLQSVAAYLQEGKHELIKVTLPEGLTLSKTAAILAERQVIELSAFLGAAQNPELLKKYGIPSGSAEGFLFPDTYFFSYNETPERIVTALLDNFFTKTAAIPHFPTDPAERYNTVILASIVEREYRVPEEAVKIAGVFSNRLEIGMGLQSCATVEYILTEVQHKPHPDRLLNKDLEIDHPYNTYKWRGLPPGPISNPGITALYAACNPEKSSYLYFRLEDSGAGTHVFTRSLAEHARAGALIVKRAAGH